MPFPSKHFLTRNTTEMKEIGAKGGRAGKNNPNVIIAAKIREMKKKAKKGKISQKEVDWFIARLEDPTANIADIKNYLDEIKKLCKTPGQAVMLANTQIALHKAHFGDKHLNQNLNVNVNIDLEKEAEELEEYIESVK
jgi:hypothetical protein